MKRSVVLAIAAVLLVAAIVVGVVVARQRSSNEACERRQIEALMQNLPAPDC